MNTYMIKFNILKTSGILPLFLAVNIIFAYKTVHTQSSKPTSSQIAQIDQLIEKADAYFQRQYFVLLEGENAFDLYKQVLMIDPANHQAQKKIREMAETSKTLANRAYKNQHYIEADLFYKQYVIIAEYIANIMKDKREKSELKKARKTLKHLTSILTPEARQKSIATSTGEHVQSTLDSNNRKDKIIDEDNFLELNQNPLFIPLLAVGCVSFFTIFFFSIYFLIIRPRKKRRPLCQAIMIIQENIESKFPHADKLLGQVVTVGLKKQDLEEALFAQAYLKARLQKYSEATAIIENLKNNAEKTREIIYLDLWLQHQQKQHKEVDKIYCQYAKVLEDFLDTKLIAGIAYLHLGQQHWERREIAAALNFFEQLQQLNKLTEYIPKHIDNHQIILGVMALFDGRFEEARKSFDGAVEMAQKAGKPTYEGELGQLLCKWRECNHPDIDDELGTVIEKMEKSTEIIKKIEEQSLDLEDAKVLLLRNALLWHAVSLIFNWRLRHEKTGLPKEERELLAKRLLKVKTIDPKMADPDLLRGLLEYYFAYEANRDEAVNALKQAQQHGMNIPEVMNLLDRDEKQREREKKVLDLFLELLKRYLNDKSIPFEIRKRLNEHLHKFSRFRKLTTEIKIGTREEETLATLQDLQTRGQLLRNRIDKIVKPKLGGMKSEDSQMIQATLEDLNKTTEILVKEKEHLEQTEQDLMLKTGEFLFQEEDKSDNDQNSSSKQSKSRSKHGHGKNKIIK